MAVQVLVIVNLLAHVPGVVTSATVTVTVPAQLSVAVTEAMEAVGASAAQLTVKLAGVPVMVGAVWSSTVINWLDVELFPHTSVAVQVLVMVNLLAHAPGVVTSSTVTVTVPAQLSVAVTEAMEATGTSAAQLTVKLAGVPVIVGAVWSSTVMTWLEVELFPHTSVAVQVLVIVNLLAQEPGVVTSSTVTITVPAQLSVAVTEAMEAAGTSAAQLTVKLAGVPVMVGTVWSSTVIN